MSLRYAHRACACVHACLPVTPISIPLYTSTYTAQKEGEKERKTKSAFLPLTAYNRLPFRKKFAIKEAAMSICNKMQLMLRLLSFNHRIDIHAARCIALACAGC